MGQSNQDETIRTPRGNLFELHYDSGKLRYFAAGPVLGGSVIPVQGTRVHVESYETEIEMVLDDLIRQLAQKGY